MLNNSDPTRQPERKEPSLWKLALGEVLIYVIGVPLVLVLMIYFRSPAKPKPDPTTPETLRHKIEKRLSRD